jgi:Na+-translocating ferredoxin:NAD+ oxidoreductase RnfG subunit
MKQKRIYGILFLFFLVLSIVIVNLNSEKRKIFAEIEDIYAQKIRIEDVTQTVKDSYITKNFPAVHRIYKVIGPGGAEEGKAFLVENVGYTGPITMAVVIDNKTKMTKGIKIIKHTETPEYAKYLTENWFTDRFKGKSTASYLNRVVLDPSDPQDIVQITGATVSSQAVVDGVNGAIGTYNYLNTGKKMASVPSSVEKLLAADENSFAVHAGDKSLRINKDELLKYPVEKVDTVLMKTTGTKQDITVEGPLLDNVLAKHGIKLSNYRGIGITGRDGYYALISKDIMDQRQIILGSRFNGKEIIEEEKPIRVVVPGEMGVYWVKMVSSIDLYEDIPEKNIKSVKIFDALARDIEPYLYEYYGNKDEAIEVGRVLAKLKNVNPKGFFTMVSSDGLIKNETINMVRQRYYIKVTGKNAPMNIAPHFKLGMNVKNIAFVNTTEDAIIFPQEMTKLTGTVKIGEKTGLPLDKVCAQVGVENRSQKQYEIRGINGQKLDIPGQDLAQCILSYHDKKVTAVYQGTGTTKEVPDLLEINIK